MPDQPESNDLLRFECGTGASDAGNVLGLVIRRALVILAAGVVLGVGSSLVLTRFLERFLWGVTRSDPGIFATIAVILIATGLIAGMVPAWRAARVDPLVALRHE